MEQANRTRELYGTKQVAVILGIPEWRVKNFTEGRAYRLPPAHQVGGSGQGSRRLYVWRDIFRIGIADELVKVGFTPESVGNAIHDISESTLAPYGARLEGQPESKTREPLLLLRSGNAWRVKIVSKAESDWKNTVKRGGTRALFALNLATVCDSIFERLNRYWTDEVSKRGSEL